MTNIFYTADGVIENLENVELENLENVNEIIENENVNLENMANVSNLSVTANSLPGNRVKISRTGIIAISEIKLYDQFNIEIPKSNLTATQSSDRDSTSTASNVIDRNPLTSAATKDTGDQWLEIKLNNSMNISRITISGLDLRNAKLEIFNDKNVSMFQYIFDNNYMSPYYDINVKYNFVTVRSVKILQPNKIWINLNEISFFDDKGVKISNNTITATQSSNYSGKNPVSNMLDNNLSTITHTNEGPNEWLEFKFASDTKISRIILHNRPEALDRIVGSKILFLEATNKPVYIYTVNDALPVYNIEINDNKWEVYQNTTTNKYIPLKKIEDQYYCMSSNGINCISADIGDIHNLMRTVIDNSKSLPINDEMLGANTVLRNNEIDSLINNNLHSVNSVMTSINKTQNEINNTQKEIELIKVNINKVNNTINSIDSKKLIKQTEEELIELQNKIDLTKGNINILNISIENYKAGVKKYKYGIIGSSILFGLIAIILLVLIIKKRKINN